MPARRSTRHGADGRTSGRHGVPEAPADPDRTATASRNGSPHNGAVRRSGPPTTVTAATPHARDDDTGLLTHPEPSPPAAPGTDARTRAVPTTDAATRAVPSGADAPTGIAPTGIVPTGVVPTGVVPTGVADAEAPTGLLPAASDAPDSDPASLTRVTGGRRHRAAGSGGPLDKVRALAGPGIETVRTKLGILDADAKAALAADELKSRRRKQVKYSLIGSAASVVLLPLLLFGIGWVMFPIPTPDDAVNNQIATVSYADGGQLARLVPEQGNRIKVPLEEIPVPVREAVLAAEDRSFYTNPGFDISGIARAAWNQIRGGDGGGSTITQQYVKNTLVGNEPSYFRKYKELIVSLKVSQQKTKDEILGDYLNAIYFGRGAYGVQSASLAYFGKPASELQPNEGALLAGVIQSPSRWDPASDPEMARERWSFVMDGMLQQGWIPQSYRATAQFPATIARENSSTSSSLTDHRGHILNAVKTELSNLGISDQTFSQGGLQITTTVDPTRQQDLVDAVQGKLDGQPDILRAGAVAIDPKTGGIVGYYGGEDGTGIDYAKVLKQPGSTFKPFAVLAGLMQEPPIGLGQKFDGSEQPGLRNAEGANCPRCTIKKALTVSNNVVFTKLAAEVGPQKVADAARLAGITQPLDNPDARLALGNKETTPVQLASAYATIAAGGVWHAPHMVSKVVDSEGRVLYEYQPGEGEQRFSEKVARNVVEAMLDVVEHDDLDLPEGQEAAGKTGTVQSRFEGENNDAWFAGFTPSLVSTVWVGTDRNDPIRNADGEPIGGAMLPGEVWQAFMSDAVRESPQNDEFTAYDPIGKSATTDEPTEAASSSATATSTRSATSAPPTPDGREESAEPAAPPEVLTAPQAPAAPSTTAAPPAPTGSAVSDPGEDAADSAGRDGEPTVG
ncbi:MAG: transglycosylase domain-containing protein [Pseudonocardia sp.]|nr:transglycosylase domain-containing protein [Pseudonocardia sp.]